MKMLIADSQLVSRIRFQPGLYIKKIRQRRTLILGTLGITPSSVNFILKELSG
jgi:hypothetical protein